ncbi:hypothetical protein [Sphingobium sp. Ant17]|uniref:hypothetical protein n=1 Tax=Sphingobium sp. Ant17 TaxID=1461752 RepID=UPI001F2B6144|nr:hypothetical protein [Sphingobium sp. Ant17]
MADLAPPERVALLEGAQTSYLGNIVLRPLLHAPVSSAHISAASLASGPLQEVGVRSEFRCHVMGADLSVEAMPLTQQDTRIGACAQAVIWMSGRHFHNRFGAPWYSMPEITANALNPSDNIITRSLPAGSDFLTADNMIRALRSMGRHPVMYAPDYSPNGGEVWQSVNPRHVVSRYVDSGIPVILGMQQAGTAIGHAVVAVGFEREDNLDISALGPHPNAGDFLSRFLVNDDQRGSYCSLPLAGGPTPTYPFCFDNDVKYLMVALPEKVFVTAEVAELIALDFAKQVGAQRIPLALQVTGTGGNWDVDPSFYASLAAGQLVARTYLTYGWKYKARALRNSAPERLTRELMLTEFPRYVWVTEFSEPAQAAHPDPCQRLIRGHTVVDATGSRFWESVLVVDLPGLSVFWHCDPERPMAPASNAVRADQNAAPYFPKIRGSLDYSACQVPADA